MLEFLKQYYIELICAVICFVHCLIQCINSHKLNKKVTKLCDNCGFPVYEGLNHDCSSLISALSSILVTFPDSNGFRTAEIDEEQFKALKSILSLLRGINNGS